ncbi:ricin-type beta-trefoil lectin domain protein [Micromonospora sp. NPDC049366]|uniref:ricin-type beta-trefoil lectin domain protein n=1 Tax=Micromonospora sp. NPDC049366 TaxID=3364271 RepID=UPI00379A0D81
MTHQPDDLDTGGRRDAPDEAPRPYLLAGLSGAHAGRRSRGARPTLALAAGLILVVGTATAVVAATTAGDEPSRSDTAAAPPAGTATPAYDLDLPPHTDVPDPAPTQTPAPDPAPAQTPAPDITEVTPVPAVPTSGSQPAGRPRQQPGPGTTGPGTTGPRPTTGAPVRPAAEPTPTPKPSTAPPAPSGRAIVSHESRKCLQAAATDGAPAQLWTCNGSAQQRWTAMSDGTIRTGGFCLDAAWSATANGTVIQVARCNGGAAQKFTLNASNDLVGRQADKCVDVREHGTANGTRTQLWTCLGTDNQKWSWR